MRTPPANKLDRTAAGRGAPLGARRPLAGRNRRRAAAPLRRRRRRQQHRSSMWRRRRRPAQHRRAQRPRRRRGRRRGRAAAVVYRFHKGPAGRVQGRREVHVRDPVSIHIHQDDAAGGEGGAAVFILWCRCLWEGRGAARKGRAAVAAASLVDAQFEAAAAASSSHPSYVIASAPPNKSTGRRRC
jgi:hypothetical protein